MAEDQINTLQVNQGSNVNHSHGILSEFVANYLPKSDLKNQLIHVYNLSKVLHPLMWRSYFLSRF